MNPSPPGVSLAITAPRCNGGVFDLADLASGTIHCWHFDLDDRVDGHEDLLNALGDDVPEQSAAPSHPVARRRSLLSRALLRTLVGRYLDVEPRSIELATGPHGKPRLRGSDGSHGLVFNASHTGRKGVLALAFDGDLGIDVEDWRRVGNVAGLLRRCFADSERAHWESLEPSCQQAELFRFWTLKEAYCKAVGRGLALGLKRCVFDCTGSHPRLTKQPADCGDPEDWHFAELAMPAGTSGAVAFNRPIRALRQFTLDTRSAP
jgi:4'-phosphopantetheinyl transferase